MPSYKVLKPGFFNGKIYSPTGKRKFVHTDKPFPMKGKKEQVPTWLMRVEEETDAQKKKRLAEEAAADKADKQKAEDDAAAIDSASFMGDGESAQIQTL